MSTSIAEWSDDDIHQYLVDLDNDEETELSDWDARFVESNLERNQFTDKQRAVVQKMVDRYGND